MGSNHQCHLTLKLQSAGVVKGDSTIHSMGRKDTIEVWELHHEVVAPRDAQTGAATGRRLHKPVSFVMPIGQATPIIYQGLSNNETVVSAEFKAYMHGKDGKEVHYLTILLEDGTISRVASHFPNTKNSEGGGFRDEFNTIDITYRKITITHVVANKTFMDDWQTQQS
jgi:type VI secretion system secreted protein Hcp